MSSSPAGSETAQSASRRAAALLLLFALVLAMLVWRRASLHVPWTLWKEGGALLWAAAVYVLCAAAAPRASTRSLATVSAVLAVVVECSRLLPAPAALEALRLSGPGRLLLGHIFDPRDFAAFALAIAALALADDLLAERTCTETTAPDVAAAQDVAP